MYSQRLLRPLGMLKFVNTEPSEFTTVVVCLRPSRIHGLLAKQVTGSAHILRKGTAHDMHAEMCDSLEAANF